MYYFEMPFRKAVTAVIVFLGLWGAIYITFAISAANYGDLQPQMALYRTLERQLLFVRHELEFVGFKPGAALAGIFGSTFGYEQQSEGHAVAVPVITYHAIIKEPDGHNVTRKVFQEQMFALKEAGWQTVTMEDFVAFLEGEKELPEKSFLLTFDDGAKDSFYPVDPILRVLDYNAVSFILTKYSIGKGTYYYLSTGELQSMLDSGRWEISSHGRDSHAFLFVDEKGTIGAALANRLWLPDEDRLETPLEYERRIHAELSESKELLESTFNIKTPIFAFPFGDFGQLSFNHHPEAGQVIHRLAREEYKHALYQTWFGEAATFNYPDKENPPFMIRRIESKNEWSGDDLLAVLEKGTPKTIPYSDPLDEDRGWSHVWGRYTLANGTLTLQAAKDATGVGAVLDGTNHVRNALFTITASSPSETGAVLWTRYLDNQNNAACNFDNEFIHIEQTIEGKPSVIKGIRESNLFPSGEFTLSVASDGRKITCYVNGVEMVSTDFLSPKLSHGSVGVKVWEAEPGAASIKIDAVDITPIES